MTTLPAWAARLLRKELRFVESGFEFNKESAVKLLALLAPRRKNEKQKARAKDKGLVKALRAARTAAIRAEVMKRADGKCELCGHPMELFGTPHMHHLIGGSAKRAYEAVENCMALCRLCHRRWHDGKPCIPLVKLWAERHGYPLPSIIRKAEASAQLPGRAAR